VWPFEHPRTSREIRPENRVTAKVETSQKSCTGLLLPRKRVLNWWKTESTDNKIRQNFFTDSESYATRSSSNGIGSGTSTGMRQIFTAIPADFGFRAIDFVLRRKPGASRFALIAFFVIAEQD